MERARGIDGRSYAALRHVRVRKSILAVTANLLACTAIASSAWAEDAPAPASTSTDDADEVVVTGSLNALPNKDVGSVFGFNKTLVETPRSASTISSEQIE